MNKDYFDWRFGITSLQLKPLGRVCILVGQWQTVYEEWLNGLQTDYWVVDAWGLWYTAYCVSILGCLWWLGAYCNLYAFGDSDRGAWTPHKNPDGFLPDLAGEGFGKTEREWWLVQCVMGLAQDNKVSKFQHCRILARRIRCRLTWGRSQNMMLMCGCNLVNQHQ